LLNLKKLTSVKPSDILIGIEERLSRGNNLMNMPLLPLSNVMLHLLASAKLHLSVHRYIPKFVEHKIHKFPHNVKCSKSVLVYAGIVCVQERRGHFDVAVLTLTVSKGRKLNCSTLKFW
jgi:hypothetical protein